MHVTSFSKASNIMSTIRAGVDRPFTESSAAEIGDRDAKPEACQAQAQCTKMSPSRYLMINERGHSRKAVWTAHQCRSRTEGDCL